MLARARITDGWDNASSWQRALGVAVVLLLLLLLLYRWRRRRRIRARYPDALYLLRRLEDSIHDERKGSPERDELTRLRAELRALLRGRRDDHAAAILLAARAQLNVRKRLERDVRV